MSFKYSFHIPPATQHCAKDHHIPPSILTTIWLCPRVLYTCSLMILSPSFPFIPHPPPLWLLQVCSFVGYIFAPCLFCWLRFNVSEIIWYLSLTAWLISLSICSPVPSMLSWRVGAPSFFLLHSIPSCRCTIVLQWPCNIVWCQVWWSHPTLFYFSKLL